MSTLEKRLEVLEASSGGDGGCERCCGLLVTVRHAITGEHHSATWNGEAISEGVLLERRTETKCPRCGRELNPGEAPIIRLRGQLGGLSRRVRCRTVDDRGGPMDNGPEHRDEEIRAAIDELNEADENVRRAREEGELWQQENPPPKQPKSVQRMAEVEEFELRNEAWNKLYMERRESLERAQARLQAAREELVSLLPQHIGYEYKGKRYQREGGSYRIDNIG